MKASTSLKKLFVSSSRRKLVQILFSDPTELYYVRQLVRLCHEEINSVRRELANLKSADLLLSEARSNRLYYTANQNSPLYPELVSFASKMGGLAKAFLDKKSLIGRIDWILLSPHFLTHQEEVEADKIDLIIIGQVSLKEIASIIKQEEESRGREINYMVMDKTELKLRKSKRDPFLVDFFLDCPHIIIGNPQKLAQI